MTAIKDILPTGKANAVSIKQIADATRQSIREVRAAVNRERNAGAIILSNRQAGGYYLPADVSEIKEFYDSNKRQAISMFKMLKSAKAALKQGEQPEHGKEETTT